MKTRGWWLWTLNWASKKNSRPAFTKMQYWSCRPQSPTVAQPKWREHGHLYKRSAAAGESRDQGVLTGRKLAIEQAVITTSQHVGVASSIWTNKTRSFAAAWWLSNSSLAKACAKGSTQRMMLTGSWKSCMQGWRNLAEGRLGSSSKVHGYPAARQNADIGWFCEKNPVTFKDTLTYLINSVVGVM